VRHRGDAEVSPSPASPFACAGDVATSDRFHGLTPMMANSLARVTTVAPVEITR